MFPHDWLEIHGKLGECQQRLYRRLKLRIFLNIETNTAIFVPYTTVFNLLFIDKINTIKCSLYNEVLAYEYFLIVPLYYKIIDRDQSY